MAALVDRTVAELGALDVMVSNAGIGERPVPIDERPAEEWSRVIAMNLNSVFFGIKHAARAMKKSVMNCASSEARKAQRLATSSGSPRGGRI